METDAGDIPNIKMTKFVERDGQAILGGRLLAWTVELYPDTEHKLAGYMQGPCLSIMAQLDSMIYTTENVRYMKMLQIAGEKWESYWKNIIDENNSGGCELSGAL